MLGIYEKFIKECYALFDFLNETFYEGEITETPVITYQRDGYGNKLGWCTVKKNWHTEGELTFYEINLSGQFLSRGKLSIAEVLLHEMVHLYANINGINDCSKSQFHNRKFKEIAESHGLEIKQKDKTRGWAYTSLTDVARSKVMAYLDGREFPVLYCDGKTHPPVRVPGQSKWIKLICPVCEMKLRTKNDKILYYCKECDIPMEIDPGTKKGNK